MVLFCELCSHPIEAYLNSETRPCHTTVCTSHGVQTECGGNSGTVHPGLRREQFLMEYPPPHLDHTPVYQGGCNIQ